MTQFKSEEYSWPSDVPVPNPDQALKRALLRSTKKISPEELYDPIEHYKTEDPIVNTVLRRYKNRSDLGMKKYKTTMWDNKADLFQWIAHLQEELMDATLYLERMKQEIEGGC